MVKAMQKAGPAWAQLLTIDIFLWAILGNQISDFGWTDKSASPSCIEKGSTQRGSCQITEQYVPRRIIQIHTVIHTLQEAARANMYKEAIHNHANKQTPRIAPDTGTSDILKGQMWILDTWRYWRTFFWTVNR